LLDGYLSNVVIISLALYGMWTVCQDLWHSYLSVRREKIRASLLVVVCNVEEQVEYMVRYIAQTVTDDDNWYDVVVVDYGSDDLTPLVLDRLAVEYPVLKVVHLTCDSRPVADGLSFCLGDTVYILDFVNRLASAKFTAVMEWLFSHL